MFELAPVSLWLEDYSVLKSLLDGLRAQGVTDLSAHLRAHPEMAKECANSLRVVNVNQRTLELFGARDVAHLVAHLPDIFRDDMVISMFSEWEQLWAGKLGFSSQTVNYTLDGRRLDILIHARVLRGHEDAWDRVMVSLEDITERERAERLRVQSEEHARNLFQHSPVSLWVEDFSAVKKLLDDVRARGVDDFKVFLNVHPEFVTRCMAEIRVIDVNDQTLRMFGAPDAHTLLGNLKQVFRDEMKDSFMDQLVDLWHGKTTQTREVINYALNGDPIHIHMQFSVMAQHLAHWDMVLVSLVDISARKKAEAYLEYLGKHDVLTGLRNRAFFSEEINRLSRKGPWPVSLLMLDLNGLKRVNDEEGHAAGDALLRRVGEVLTKAVDDPGYAARIGGDEFVVLLPGADERSAQLVTDRILSVVDLNNQFYPGQRLSMAIGRATCSSGEQLDLALSHADAQMYEAKAQFYRENQIERRTTGAAA